jgi:hypothetical protein
VRQWRERLEGSTWAVEMRPMAGDGKPSKDTLTFKDRQLTSSQLSKEGYGSSNFSLRAEGEAVIWETMQSKEGAAAFWRGEVMGETVRGVLSKKVGEGPSADYSFGGTPVSGYTSPVAAAASEAVEAATPMVDAAVVHVDAPVAPAPEAQPPAKKKKRGWR